MPKNLRKTLEKAEGDLITEVKEWIRDATTEQMRELLTVFVELEEVEVEDEEGNAVDNPFSTLQEYAVTWAQLNNLLVQVEAAEPEDDDEEEEAEGEPEKSPAETPKSAAPQKASGRKGGKHRHCCEIGKHEAEAAAAAEAKPPHPPPAAL